MYSEKKKKFPSYLPYFFQAVGAPVAQWVERWPTDPAVRVRSQLEAKSSQA